MRSLRQLSFPKTAKSPGHPKDRRTWQRMMRTHHALDFEGCVEEPDIKLFEESPYSRSRRGLYLLPLDPAMPRDRVSGQRFRWFCCRRHRMRSNGSCVLNSSVKPPPSHRFQVLRTRNSFQIPLATIESLRSPLSISGSLAQQ